MNSAKNVLIWTEEVTKIYNRRLPDEVLAVDRVSITVDRGDVAVLKGPSGSGKTSLLSLIGCMSRPTSGKVFVDGRDVAKLAESVLTRMRRKRFGFIFQQFNLVPNATVLENVILPLYPVGISLARILPFSAVETLSSGRSGYMLGSPKPPSLMTRSA